MLNWSYVVHDFALFYLGLCYLLSCCSDNLSSITVVLQPKWPINAISQGRGQVELLVAIARAPLCFELL